MVKKLFFHFISSQDEEEMKRLDDIQDCSQFIHSHYIRRKNMENKEKFACNSRYFSVCSHYYIL